jgi:tRNA A37 threonylcarbamoyladenosine dehydratase
VSPKTQLLAACVRAKVPVVSSMGSGNKFDPSQIKTVDIAKTGICPLARVMRRNLKEQGIVAGVACVYSTEVPVHCYGPAEKDLYQRGRLRRPIGSIAYRTGAFGMAVAGEATKIILEQRI